MIQIDVAPSGVDWDELLSLLTSAFASMHGRIDPPSSLLAMSADDLRRKATHETLITARTADGDLVGCLFGRTEGDLLYVGKMAVAEQARGAGIGRKLMDQARVVARRRGLVALELETRIELAENHETFAKLGFVTIAEDAHQGYDRVTFIRMRSRL